MNHRIYWAALFISALLAWPAAPAAEPDRKTQPITVSGRAIDADGSAIPGATILLVSTNGISQLLGEATADEDGRFAFRDVPLPIPAPASRAYFEYGSFRVIGRAPGYALAWRATRHLLLDPRFEFDPTARDCGFYPGEEVVLDLTFEKPYAVTGRVVDEQGRSIAGVRIKIANCDYFIEQKGEPQRADQNIRSLHEGAQFLPDDCMTTSAADGRFEFKTVAPERFCSIVVEHPDYVRGQLRVATSEDPPKREREAPLRSLPVALTLQWKYSIPVRVSWAETGRPATGVSVLAIPDAGGSAGNGNRGMTDQEGKVVFRIPKGKYRLRGEPPRESEYVISERELIVDEEPRPERPVYFEMARGARLTLKVVDAKTGRGIPEISFWSREGKAEGERVDIGSISTPTGYRTTNAEGEIRAVVVPGIRHYGFSPGPAWDYRSADPADVNTGRELKIVAGESTTLEFKVNLRPTAEPLVEADPAVEASEPVAVAGRVIYDAAPPARKLVAGMIGHASRGLNRGPPIFDDSVLVDPESRGLANVVIYFDRVPAGVKTPAATRFAVALSIQDGRFEPRVSTLRPGHTCTLTNQDPEITNVRLETLVNPQWNKLLSPQKSITWHFDKPERLPVRLRSDIHTGMQAYQFVTDHPWIAVTDKTGHFAIRGLPPGKYQFKVWHETAGFLEKVLAVEVQPGAATELTLTYPPARFGR